MRFLFSPNPVYYYDTSTVYKMGDTVAALPPHSKKDVRPACSTVCTGSLRVIWLPPTSHGPKTCMGGELETLNCKFKVYKNVDSKVNVSVNACLS